MLRLPISLVAWFVDRQFGIATSVVCALVWHFAEIAAGHVYSNPFYLYWNTGISSYVEKLDTDSTAYTQTF